MPVVTNKEKVQILSQMKSMSSRTRGRQRTPCTGGPYRLFRGTFTTRGSYVSSIRHHMVLVEVDAHPRRETLPEAM